MLDRSKCGGCGHPTWLSHDPKSKWRPKKVKCESCEAISVLQEMQPEDLKHPQAYHFYTEHVE